MRIWGVALILLGALICGCVLWADEPGLDEGMSRGQAITWGSTVYTPNLGALIWLKDDGPGHMAFAARVRVTADGISCEHVLEMSDPPRALEYVSFPRDLIEEFWWIDGGEFY